MMKERGVGPGEQGKLDDAGARRAQIVRAHAGGLFQAKEKCAVGDLAVGERMLVPGNALLEAAVFVGDEKADVVDGWIGELEQPFASPQGAVVDLEPHPIRGRGHPEAGRRLVRGREGRGRLAEGHVVDGEGTSLVFENVDAAAQRHTLQLAAVEP